ncbi:DUF6603 domain-containing protein [Geodermatophilus sp. SYSU D00703]
MSFDAQVISPELVKLGVALGVLTPGPDGYDLNGAFFADPATTLGAVLKDPARRRALLELARAAFGSGNLDSASLPDAALGVSWLPVAEYGPATAYVVLESTEAGTTLALAAGVEHDADGVGLSGSVWLPLIEVPATGGPRLLPDGPDGRLGLRFIVRPPPGPADPVVLDALVCEATIPTAGDPPSLDVSVVGLKVSGWASARDVRLRSNAEALADDAADLARTLLDLVAASTGLDPEAATALHRILTLVGLGDATRIPRLRLDDVRDRGVAAVREWAEGILADPTGDRQESWLRVLAELAGLDPGEIQVEVSPTTGLTVRLTPAGVSPSVYAHVRVATTGGHVDVDLGVSVTADAPKLGTGAAAVPVRGRAHIDLVHAVLTGSPSVTWLPAIELETVLGDADHPLLTTAATHVGQLRLGLVTDAGHRVRPVLGAQDVSIGPSRFPALDLTSVEALTQAAGDAAAQGLGDLLTPLFGPGADARVAALLVLLGIQRPAQVDTTWPPLPGAAAFFADPLTAVGRYHARVLGAGGYDRLVTAACVLFGIVDDVPGSGTELDPWMVRIPVHEPVDLGTVDVLVRGTGGQAAPVLRVDALITLAPVLLDSGDELTIAGLHRVARIELPAAEHARLAMTACDRHEVRLLLEARHPTGVAPEDFEDIRDIGLPDPPAPGFTLPPPRLTFDAGPVLFSCRALAAALWWERGPGWDATVRVEDGTVQVGDVDIELPDGFGLDWLLGGLDLSAAWPLLRLLFSARLTMPRLRTPDLDLPDLQLPDFALPDLPDLNLPTLSLPELLAAFLGWTPATLPFRLRLPDGLCLDLQLPEFGGNWPAFDLPAFLLSPLPTIRLWLGKLFSGDLDLSLPTISFTALLCGRSEVAGSGTHNDPWAIALPGTTSTAGPIDDAGPAGGGASLLFWLDPDGPTLAGLEDVFAGLLPADLVPADPEDPDTPPPAAADLLEVLAGGARIDAGLAELLAGREHVAEALETLRTAFVDGDGLVPAAQQVHPGDEASPVVLSATHVDAPAHFVLSDHSAAAPTTVMYLCAPLPGVSPWPGQDGGARLDLRGAGRPATSFVFAPPATGPWFVLMPTRDDAGGHAGVVERLRVAVAAVSAAAGGAPVVVAHSITSWAARTLHADGTVPELVTVAAPGPAPSTTGSTAGAVVDTALDAARFVQALAGRVTDVPEPLRGVLTTIASRLGDGRPDSAGIPRQIPFPLTDMAPPPAGGGTASAAAPVTAVVARLASADFDRSLTTLTAEVLRTVLARLPVPGGPPREPVTHLGFGLGVDLPAVAVPGAVNALTSVRLDVATVRLRSGGTARTLPRLRTRVVLQRPGGWLLANPSASIRRAEILLDLVAPSPDGAGAASSLRFVLFDAGLGGILRERLEIRADSLDATGRELLAELAAALSPLPPSGTLADLVAVLDAIGLVRVHTDGSLDFEPDATERLLADPLAHLASVLRSRTEGWSAGARAALEALRRLLGAPASNGQVTDPIVAEPVPGVRLVVDPERAILRMVIEGLTVAGVVRAGADVVAPLPFGRPVSEATWQLRLSPAPADGTSSGGGGDTFPAVVLTFPPAGELAAVIQPGATLQSIPLLPEPDQAALGRYVRSLAVDQVLRMVLSAATDASDELRTLVHSVGLVDADGEIHDALGLFTDPLGRLTDPRALGSESTPGRISPAKVAAVLDAIADLTGVRADEEPALPGLPLPLGGRITARAEGDGLLLDLALRTDAGPVGGLVAAGGRLSLAVRIDPAWVPSTSVTCAVRVHAGGAGVGLAAAELEVTGGAGSGPDPAGGLQMVLRLWPDATGAPTVVPLLPESAGLGPLAALIAQQAAQHVLPLLLDQLAALGSTNPALARLGTAIEAAGEALGLRSPAGSFDLDALRRLAADPPAWLVARFRANPTAVASALAEVAALARNRPAAPGALWSGLADRVRLEMHADDAGRPVLSLLLTDLRPLNGFVVRGRIVVGAQGLGSSTLALLAVPPDRAAPDPIELLPGAWPFVELHLGGAPTADPPRFEVGLWLDPPTGAGADALVLQVPFGGSTELVHRRGTSTDDDVSAAFTELILEVVIPLVVDAVLGLPAVRDALEKTKVGAEELVDLLTAAGVLISGVPPGAAPPRLAPGVLSDPLGAAVPAVVALVDAFLATADLGPVHLRLRNVDLGQARRYLLGVVLEQPLDLPPLGDVAVAVRAQDETGTEPVLEVAVVEVAKDLHSPSPVRFAPRVRVDGLGVAVTGAEGPLNKDPLRVQGVALYGRYEHAGSGFVSGGGRVEIVGIEIPVGSASGGTNPVAGKVIAPGDPPGDGSGSGSAVTARGPTPGITPYADIDKLGTGPVTVAIGLEGEGWIPIRRSFGPVYVEQIGFDLTDPASFALLLDAGVHIGPLAAGVDDLAVVIPLASPANPATWRLDLAGLAISFAGGGVSIAGGLRKLVREGGVEYIGMLDVRAAGYGLTALGAFGSFPVRVGSSDRYTSLFVIAALAAPLGGPPAFFVLGIGGGVGLNRALVAPREMTEVATFPLIAALDPGSQLVADPMAALVNLGRTFPPRPGAFWLAAGVRFSSFTLVESIVAVTVAVGDGLEVNVLGLARAGLPNPGAPVVQLELALQARFSTRDGVLLIRAQLTDNSWLFNTDCRLTGGFAFVIWFRTGEFLVTIGGYHPRYPRRDHYPDVPRVGFSWRVSSVITIKGESYFALTPTAIMTGGRLEATANFGIVGAWFACGLDILLSWDPFYYDISIYVTIGAWLNIEIKIWFIHITIRITVSVGAELLIQGPPMHGVARVDLAVTTVVVPFGSPAVPAKDWLGWAAFHDKYLVAGDPAGATMDVTITRGSFTPDPGSATGAATGSDLLQVLPEFQLRTTTRAAATVLNGTVLAGPPLAAGPMGRARITSEHRISVRKGPPPGQEFVQLPPVAPVIGAVPDAVWRMPTPNGEGGMRDAFVGGDVIADVKVAGSVEPIDLRQFQVGAPRLLPLLAPRDPGGTLSTAAAAADAWAAAVAGQDPLALAGQLMAATRGAALVRCLGRAAVASLGTGPGVLDALLLSADRSAPPRLERPTARACTPAATPHAVRVRQLPQPPVRTPPDVPAPRLIGAARLDAVPSRRPRARTTVGDWGAAFPRTHPEDLSSVLARIRPTAARLYRTAPAAVGQPRSGGPPLPQTVLRAGTRGAHAVPGGRLEAVPGLFADDRAELLFATRTAGLTAAGTPLRSGDIQVWRVAVAADDWNPERPVLGIDGNQAVRVVMLDLAGSPLADTTVSSGELKLPPGIDRLAILGTGVPPDQSSATAAPAAWPLSISGLAGWHVGVPVLRTGEYGFVVPGGVLRTTGVTTLRGRRPVDVALIDPELAVGVEGLVSTTLPPGTRSVIVGLRPLDPAANTSEFLIGLDDATTVSGSCDRVLTAGGDVYLIRNVEPGSRAPVVTVGRAPGFALRGLLGSCRPADVVETFIADQGAPSLVGGLVPGAVDRRHRTSTLTWRRSP